MPNLFRPPIRPSVQNWALGGLLFAGTVLLYFRSTGFGFINYDDPQYITNNEAIQSGLNWQSLSWAFTAPTANWHPLTWFSHLIDWSLFGESAAGHHLTSIGWHAGNVVLLFLLLRRLTGALWTSVFAAALFAWHPLHVESVTWLAERKDVLSGFFFLLSLHSYAAYASRRTLAQPATRFYLLTLLLFLFGLMSKPMVVTLPVILLVLDYWPLRRLPDFGPGYWSDLRRLVREKIPFFLISVVSSATTIVMQHAAGSFTLELPLLARVLNAFVATVRYLGKFLWPEGLCVAYPHPGYWHWLVVTSAIALTVTLMAVAWRQRHRQPWLLAGWAWFVVMLLPVIGLIQVGFQSMADRYTYLPAIGIEVALLWSWRALAQSRLPQVAGVIVAALILFGCALRTWQQQAVWRDSITLFSHALAVTENNAMAEGFLAYTYLGRNDLPAAETHAQRALSLDPDNLTALQTLADVRRWQTRFPEAIELYQRILRRDPKNSLGEYHLGLSLLHLRRAREATAHLKAAVSADPELRRANFRLGAGELLHGDPQRALVHLQIALDFEPKNPDLHFSLGSAYSRTGEADAALASFLQTLQLRPDHVPAHTEVGLLLLQKQQPAEAAEHFRQALAVQPRFGLAWAQLGRAAEALGHSVEANTCFERAADCSPENPAVFIAWAEVLARRSRFADAISRYQRALQLQPGNADAHAGLGYMLYLSHQREAALPHWEEALRINPNFPGLRERLARARLQSNQ